MSKQNKNNMAQAAMVKQEQKNQEQAAKLPPEPNYTAKTFLPIKTEKGWDLVEVEIDPVLEVFRFGKKIVNGNNFNTMYSQLKKGIITEYFRKNRG